jgi:5-methylcytosine-specific restriction protein A
VVATVATMASSAGEKRFYSSRTWRAMRLQILERDQYVCMICGLPTIPGSPTVGMRPVVDHIVPLRVRPESALDPDNLRASHGSCNSSRVSKKPPNVSWEPAVPW